MVCCIQNVDAVALPAGVEAIQLDLQDRTSLASLPRQWDSVIHLAGASIPNHFTSPDLVILNTLLTLNLLEHLEEAKVLLVSSCHVYAPSDLVRTEDSPLLAQGRYGLSKHLIEQMADHYRRRLDIRIARPFNHLGPYQRPELVIPSLLRRLQEGGVHDTSPVVMKGTNSTRDFVDVEDVVAAYLSIIQIDSPRHQCFNVCTGIPRTIREVVEITLQLLGTARDIVFEGHPNSDDDNPFVVGSPARLMEASGWQARIPIARSLERMLLSQRMKEMK
jgi:GDP-4-dehydro-6-deoxy-D-mannose reductase